MKKQIRDLPANPACSAVYKRDDGNFYIRLNDKLHVKSKRGEEEGQWIGDGAPEQLDPNEEVEVFFESAA